MNVSSIHDWLVRRRLALSGCLFIAAAHAVVLSDAGFGPFAVPVMIAVIGFALVPLAIALPLSRWRAGGAAVFAFGTTYFLDVTYVGGGLMASAVLVLLAALLILVIGYRKSDELVAFCITAVAAATVFIVGQQSFASDRLAPRPLDLSGAADGDGRPYLHIILDEMGSIDLMPQGAYYDALRARMTADYAKRGFDLFADTMAPSGDTRLSLGRVLGDGRVDEAHRPYAIGGRETYEIRANGAAKALTDAGYRVNILQSDYLGICDPDANWTCGSYARSGEGASLFAFTNGLAERLSYVAFELHASLVAQESVRASMFYSLLASLAGAEVPHWRPGLTRPSLVLSMMNQARVSLRDLSPGEAYFAHLLLPHFPYVMDDNCHMKSPALRAAPAWVGQGEGGVFSPEKAERAYWEQVSCTHDALMAMVDAAIGNEWGRDAVIVIHGDHGSRLFEKAVDPDHDDLSPSHRRHALQTHLAVRGLPEIGARLEADSALEYRVRLALEAVVAAPQPAAGAVAAAAADNP